MEILSDDPTYLVAGLGILAVIFLAMVRVTQQGKYLYWAMGTGALALLLLAIDWVWVTDAERIEAVVYDLRRAVMRSDVDAMRKHLNPNVQLDTSPRSRGFYYERGPTLHGSDATDWISSILQHAHFDFLRIHGLVTHAGARSRRGTAEFHVVAAGSLEGEGFLHVNFGTTDSVWSLGFVETSPHVWKVERISAVQLPDDAQRIFPRRASSSRKQR